MEVPQGSEPASGSGQLSSRNSNGDHISRWANLWPQSVGLLQEAQSVCHLGSRARHSSKLCAHRLHLRADTSRPRPSCTGNTVRPLCFLSMEAKDPAQVALCVFVVELQSPNTGSNMGLDITGQAFSKINLCVNSSQGLILSVEGPASCWLISVENPESSRP